MGVSARPEQAALAQVAQLYRRRAVGRSQNRAEENLGDHDANVTHLRWLFWWNNARDSKKSATRCTARIRLDARRSR